MGYGLAGFFDNFKRLFGFKKPTNNIQEKAFIIASHLENINEYYSTFWNSYLDYKKNNPKKIGGGLRAYEKIYQLYKIMKNDFRDFFSNLIDKETISEEEIDSPELFSKLKNTEDYLDLIIHILKALDEQLNNIRDYSWKNIDLREFENDLNEYFKEREIFKELAEKDRDNLINLIEDIFNDAINNAKKNNWLVINNRGKDEHHYFSSKFTIGQIRKLELIPLINLFSLKKRNQWVMEIHKDNTLNVYHYNLEYKGINIHVIPLEHKKKIAKRIKYLPDAFRKRA